MSQLGTYITSEYGILTKILSYLPQQSLEICKDVCREWSDVSKRLLQQRNRPHGYFRHVIRDEWLKFSDYIKPKLVLHFHSYYMPKERRKGFNPMVADIYGDEISIFIISNPYFIFSQYANGKLEIEHRLGKYFEAALLLGDMPGVSVNYFYYQDLLLGENNESEKQLVEKIMNIEGIKCILVISASDFEYFRITDLVIENYIQSEKSSTIFLVGGSSALGPTDYRPEDRLKARSPSYFCLTFSGPNVISVGGIHDYTVNLEDFLKDFSKRCGPPPLGSDRIAFMFSCINRLELLKENEVQLFQKYFPDVPIYGLWSYGEMFVQLDKDYTLEPTGRFPPHRSECTSYLILTFL